MEHGTPCASDSVHQNQWIEIQDELKKRLITKDDFKWGLNESSRIFRACEKAHQIELCTSSSSSQVEQVVGVSGGEEERKEVLKYVGGVDISFLKEDPSLACGTLVVLDIQSLNVVYVDFIVDTLNVPYVPGFLAFREAPILLNLLEKMKKDDHPFYPQLLMVDGNGLLHPRGFGLACHLGVIADLPTIGVGKNLHHVEGLNHSEVTELLERDGDKESIYLTGNSGRTLGVAMRSTRDTMKPIFISVGHCISLTTAIKIVRMTCKFRVPEPIRQADIRSREYLRKHLSVQPNP